MVLFVTSRNCPCSTRHFYGQIYMDPNLKVGIPSLIYYLLCLKLRTTTYAELPWSLGLSLFPYFWHLQQLGCHSFLIFDIDSSWLTGFCFKKREREKISFLGPKKQTEKPCVSSHTAATGSSLTVCMLVSLHATPHLWPESLMKNLNILAILGLSEPKWWE